METIIDIEDADTKFKLLKLPKMIYEQELKINALQTKTELLKAKIEALKTILMAGITQETEEGKPKFKNEDSRNSELLIRMNADHEYPSLRKEHESKTFDISIEQIRLKYLLNVLSATKALTRLEHND